MRNKALKIQNANEKKKQKIKLHKVHKQKMSKHFLCFYVKTFLINRMQKNVNENLVFCDLLNNAFVQPFFEIRKNKNFLLPESGYAPYANKQTNSSEKKSTSQKFEKCLIFWH